MRRGSDTFSILSRYLKFFNTLTYINLWNKQKKNSGRRHTFSYIAFFRHYSTLFCLFFAKITLKRTRSNSVYFSCHNGSKILKILIKIFQENYMNVLNSLNWDGHNETHTRKYLLDANYTKLYTHENFTPSSLEKQFLQCSRLLRTLTSVPWIFPSEIAAWQTLHLKQSRWKNKPKFSIIIAAPLPSS